MIHRTLTDDDGNKYRIVSSKWLKTLTVISIVEFIILMLIVAGLIDNVRRVENAMDFSATTAQRYKALAEVAAERTTANKWAFDQVCKEVIRLGGTCPQVKWYADPEKYPLITDDPAGVGIFPPTPTPTQ